MGFLRKAALTTTFFVALLLIPSVKAADPFKECTLQNLALHGGDISALNSSKCVGEVLRPEGSTYEYLARSFNWQVTNGDCNVERVGAHTYLDLRPPGFVECPERTCVENTSQPNGGFGCCSDYFCNSTNNCDEKNG